MRLSAQPGGVILSGTVTSQTGTVVPNARVSVKNLLTNRSMEARTDSSGRYLVPNLASADYEITISAEGFSPKVSKLTISTPSAQTLDFTLQPPGAEGGAPSLADLGITPQQTQGSAAAQARLDRRSHMLKIHQRLGLITLAPLAATLITSAGAGGHNSTSSGRQLHAALGSVTAGMYLTTASFAIFAPKIQGTTTRGPIRLHKALAWIHGPGMILTPILGAMAYNQRSNGQRVHGIAQAHGAVGAITGIAYGLAMLSVSIKF